VGAAADVLSIPARDLDGTYRTQPSDQGNVELVIFDRIPGGAGYVHRVRQDLRLILDATLKGVMSAAISVVTGKEAATAVFALITTSFSWSTCVVRMLRIGYGFTFQVFKGREFSTSVREGCRK